MGSWGFDKADLKGIQALPWWLVRLFGVSGVLVAGWGFFCLTFAFKTVRPNGLPSLKSFSTLLPARKDAWKQKDACDYLDAIVKGTSREFALGEFRQQLLAVGGIVFNKVKWLRVSILCLMWQGGLALLFVLLVVWAVGSGTLRKGVLSEPEPPKKVASS